VTGPRRRLGNAEGLFHQISALPEPQREAAITRLAGPDDALAAEVRSLLEHFARAQGFLQHPALGSDFALLPAAPGSAPERGRHDEMVGQTIDRYRIEQRIASGGMGTVYLAVRADQQFMQRVALKIVKRGMDTEDILQRFRRERQTLAALEHPNIARLLDGGATSSGQPYLVMELVEGEPIDAYCDRRRASLDERLELFLVVCEAVRHAHQNLVVHRDLKPGNILVTAEGTPKLLDFGIATVLDPTGARQATSAAERRLTPEYASPEQLAGAGATTTFDVYSLGVILCELLCGRGPYRFATHTLPDIERAVATGPGVPSELVRQGAPRGELVEAARARRSTPEHLARALRGDLDTIVLAALRHEPARRYPSVERLATDVRAHLDHQPVSARRDTLAYRASKFVRRHALATTLALLSLALLVTGVAAFAWQTRVARQQRDEAELARARGESVTGFLEHMLESPDPARAGPTVTVREILDEAARRLDGELEDQPLVQASLRSTIGRTYLALGLFREAEAELRAALREKSERLGTRHPEVARSRSDLASALYSVESYEEAADLLQSAAEAFRSSNGAGSAEEAVVLSSLGAVRRAQGRIDEAERLHREALDLRTRRSGRDSLEVAESLNNLANVLQERARYSEAEPLLEEALSIRRAHLGPKHPLVAQSMDNLAELLQRKGALDEAETLRWEALDLELELLGPDHPDVALTRRRLALLLIPRGELAQAEELLRQSLAVRERALPPSSLQRVVTMLDLASVLLARDQGEEAEELVEAALDATRDLAPEAEAHTWTLAQAAAFFTKRGQPERAAELRAQLSSGSGGR
jgi:serine/threonine-protein kinase